MTMKYPAGYGTFIEACEWAKEIDGPMGSKEPADWLKVIALALIAIAENQMGEVINS